MSKNGVKHVMQTERCLFISHLDAQNKQIDSTKRLNFPMKPNFLRVKGIIYYVDQVLIKLLVSRGALDIIITLAPP